MSVNIIIQARTTSRRLPSKVLRKIGSKPLIAYVIERCLEAKNAQKVVIATTSTDYFKFLPFYREYGVGLFGYGARHEARNVAERFRACLSEYPCEAFVRICADSPLVDPKIIDRCILILGHRKTAVFTGDVVPDGMNVQACNTEIFRNSLDGLNTYQKEHVLSHIKAEFYNPSDIPPGLNGMKPKFTVDTAKDLRRVRKLINAMPNHLGFDYIDVLKLWMEQQG